MNLPVELTRYFADSTITVESYDALRGLSVRVEKEIGAEIGIIQFRDVAFLSLPTCFPGESVKVCSISETPESPWIIGERENLDLDHFVVEIESQDGPTYHVVCKDVEYQVVSSAI
ncbi:MAG: hypothetical protein K2W95_25700 [Candidatus Obscuribacterales bacterium]|nr:hypothetical protein [Candidatus Obscuribacterales bacterium]